MTEKSRLAQCFIVFGIVVNWFQTAILWDPPMVNGLQDLFDPRPMFKSLISFKHVGFIYGFFLYLIFSLPRVSQQRIERRVNMIGLPIFCIFVISKMVS